MRKRTLAAEQCVICGDVIPEGKQMCPNCEERIGTVKECGFELKPCVRKCIYYRTCTRNPYRYGEQKGS